jgi:CheY-like chemotaxis protein
MSKVVLLVEDYADVRMMMRFMLEKFGYEVIEARKHGPDLVLMDIAMPVMNGITSATLIRSLDNCQNVPIVAVTAFCDQYVESSSEFGFDEVIEKPINMEQLREVVYNYAPQAA